VIGSDLDTMTSRESAAPERAGDRSTRVPGTGAWSTGAQPVLARVVLAALLVVLVLVGLRGGLTTRGWSGPWRLHGIAIGIAAEIILAGLLVAVLVRGWRAPDDFLAGRLRQVLRAVLLAALIAIPVSLLASARLRGHLSPPWPLPSSSVPPALRPTVTARPHPPAALNLPVAEVFYALLSLALAAAIVACVVLLRRRLRHTGELPPEEASLADADQERAELREAVASGRRALATLGEARAAIIACYLAMEGSLAAAGATRTEADTPGEFLARAAADGVVRGSAAGQLTGLFYEARFSAHEMTAAQRTAAERALRQLAADLGGKA
jgi:Domain of unknown function (DUF4129)